MRIIRIYQNTHLAPGLSMQLSEEAGQHVGVVLRMQPGDRLIVFCGDNKEYQAKIEQVHRKKVQIFIESEKFISRESPLSIHLVQAISKGDRMEWVIQKAVELGVNAITPVITEYCAVKLDKEKLQKKISQWQAIVRATCEQSERNWVPSVNTPLSYHDYLKEKKETVKFILEPYQGLPLKEYSIQQEKTELLVGPEGGFSEREVTLAMQAGFAPLRLGPRILRTETAAIAAISLLQAMSGDL